MDTKQNNNNKTTKHSQYGKVYLTDITSLRGCSGSDALVYLSLLYHSDMARIAFPSISMIMNETDLSRASVKRALKNLKETYSLIKVVARTPSGVNKYRLGGISSEPSIRSEPRVKPDTPPGSDLDPPPGSDLNHSKEKKLTENINNKAAIAALKTNDERLFLLLWEKWKDNKLCCWASDNPLASYRIMRDNVISLWKRNKFQKDLEYELIVFDIYLMMAADEITEGKEYQGPPRLYGAGRWVIGLRKWLSSSRKSYMNQQRKIYSRNAISLSVQHIEEPPKNDHEDNNAINLDKGAPNLLDLRQDTQDAHKLLQEFWDTSNSQWWRWVELASGHNNKTPFAEYVLKEMKNNRSIQIFDDYLSCL